MGRTGLRVWAVVCFAVGSLVWCRVASEAVTFDKDGDIKLGVRTYVNARVGTENTHDGALIRSADRTVTTSTSATFPHSSAGHLRQNRFFIEAEYHHDLKDMVKRGAGPLSLLSDLPFKVKNLAYHLTFRGEGEGLYDWGPVEYSTAVEFQQLAKADPPNALVNNQPQAFQDPAGERRRARKLGVDRERLFQAYVEADVGDLFVRFGRQILSWGETDGFRLLDNINPLDSSFGGFLISIDERRVPIDMARTQYRIGSIGPFSEMFLEGYVAIDNKVAFYPGTGPGSPWGLPSNTAPSNDVKDFRIRPSRTFNDARGGARLVFNALDATFSLAHYYTYFDTEALQLILNPNLPGTTTTKGILSAFNDGRPCPVDRFDASKGEDPNNRTCGAPVHVFHTAPKVQVSGATTTFALPQFYSIVRAELAYFKDEPAFTQRQLDPFIFNPLRFTPKSSTTGGRRLRDSINAMIGLDVNQWIRVLNPNQTFFISTQFFYKHIKNSAGKDIFVTDASGNLVLNPDREVLPLYLDVRDVFLGGSNVGRLEPVFIRQPRDRYLQTLFIGTSYRSGTISPGLTLFYDWGGAFLYQPGITFSRDPFRFAIDYSIIDSHIYKGGSGVSLLKDRDNIQFRFEYVI